MRVAVTQSILNARETSYYAAELLIVHAIYVDHTVLHSGTPFKPMYQTIIYYSLAPGIVRNAEMKIL